MPRTMRVDPATLPPLHTLDRQAVLMPRVVAAYLGISAATLDKWRRPSDGRPTKGPRYRRLGEGPKARVRYCAGDVLDYINGRVCDTDESAELQRQAERARLAGALGAMPLAS